MSAWPQQQQNGVFPGMLDASNQQNMFDPSSMNQMYGNGTINPSQFNNAHMQQRMPNGAMHPQASFQGQNFNVPQVVPAKRSSDGMAMSPGPAQNTNLNASRSQTPMQPGTPYQAGQQGQQFPNPYQHLQQNNSANASPSPTIQNQQFRQPQPPQRMTSQSPANFGMQSNAPGQMSPAPSQHQAMSMSPSVPQQSFSPNLAGGAGFQQPFPNQNMMAQGMQGAMNNMNAGGGNMTTAQMQAKLQQAQFMQQQRALQARGLQGGAMGGRQPSSQMGGQMGGQQGQQFNPNMMQGQGQGMANGQQHPQQGQPQQGQPGQQQSGGTAAQHEKARAWLVNLQSFMASQGKPFNPQPVICGRPTNLYILWACIVGVGGSARINANSGWNTVAAKLGFQNNPSAAQEVRNAFDTYLSPFERHAMARQAQARQAAQARQGSMPGQQGSPTRQMQPGQQEGQQNQFMQINQGQGQMGMQQQQGQMSGQPGMQMQNGMQTPGMAQQMDPMQVKRQQSVQKQESVPPQTQPDASPAATVKSLGKAGVKREGSVASVHAPPPKQEETEYLTISRSPGRSYRGGYDVDENGSLTENTTNIIAHAQESIRAQTLFKVDIRSLTMCLQSGIAAEVRYAIDSLVDLSSRNVLSIEKRPSQQPPPWLMLDRCGDLLDAIVDTLDEHVDALSEAQAESSSAMRLMPYEQLLKTANADQDSLQRHPEPGTIDYATERLADRIVSLLLLLFNLSMDGFNHMQLASPPVISAVCNVLHQIGTRKLFLRTNLNTLDSYKYLVLFLSNVAGPRLEIPTRDDVLYILHFLVAFGPQPAPSVTSGEAPEFRAYKPLQHRYLPAAVDTLAKLLARQEPNRTFLRSIFTASSLGADDIHPADLFTRAFGMSISFLPDRKRMHKEAELMLLRERGPYLCQGMLAADILSSLVPTPSASSSSSSANGTASTTNPTTAAEQTPPHANLNLARLWLESPSNWPASLLHMALQFAANRDANFNLRPVNERPVMRDGKHQPVLDEHNDLPGMAASRALSMLGRLVEGALKGPRRNKEGKVQVVNGVQSDYDTGVNGTAAEVNGEAQDKEVEASARHGDDSDADSEASIPFIRGDPLPKRETLAALVGSTGAVDTEALRLLDRLYDLVVPGG